MFDSVTGRCQGPVAAKQAQIITPPTCAWQLVWGMWVFQTWCCALWPNICTHVRKTLFHKSCDLWCNLSHAAMFFFKEKRIFPCNPSKQAQSFQTLLSRTLAQLLGTLSFLWTLHSLTLGELNGTSTPGKIGGCLKPFLSWIILTLDGLKIVWNWSSNPSQIDGQ